MAFSGDINIEGRFTVRPLYLKEQILLFGKILCRFSLNLLTWNYGKLWTTDHALCLRSKNDKGEEIDKPKDQYTSADWERPAKTLELNIFSIVVQMLMSVTESLLVTLLNKYGIS